jgi:hypothetical protein
MTDGEEGMRHRRNPPLRLVQTRSMGKMPERTALLQRDVIGFVARDLADLEGSRHKDIRKEAEGAPEKGTVRREKHQRAR